MSHSRTARGHVLPVINSWITSTVLMIRSLPSKKKVYYKTHRKFESFPGCRCHIRPQPHPSTSALETQTCNCSTCTRQHMRKRPRSPLPLPRISRSGVSASSTSAPSNLAPLTSASLSAPDGQQRDAAVSSGGGGSVSACKSSHMRSSSALDALRCLSRRYGADEARVMVGHVAVCLMVLMVVVIVVVMMMMMMMMMMQMPKHSHVHIGCSSKACERCQQGPVRLAAAPASAAAAAAAAARC